MPQLQVLPGVPSFGQQLSQALGQAGSDIGQGFIRRAENQRAQRGVGVLTDPRASPVQKITALMQLPEEYKKHVAPIWAAVLGPQAQSHSELEQLSKFKQGMGMMGQQPQLAGQSTVGAEMQPQIESANNLANGKEAAINPSDVSSYPDTALSEMAALSGLPGRIAQQEQQRRQVEHSRETEAFKATSDYREKLLNEYEGSKRTIAQLNRLEALSKEGKLTTPLMAKLSESMGIPLSVLANPASEEFQKVSQDLMSNITKYFGNRILQVEVENFLKTIPTLTNSPEGKERVIKNMKMLLEPQKMAYEAYKDIRQKEGKIPIDLHERVLEKIEPKLDKLSEDFKKNASDFSVIIAPDGREVKVPRDQVDKAIQAGGVLK